MRRLPRVFAFRSSRLRVKIDEARIVFIILGSEEALGYEAGANVASCRRCRAQVEACMYKPG